MPTKNYAAIGIAFAAGAVLGILGFRFVDSMREYSNVPRHVQQGREILNRIESYRSAHGHLPDQEWFSALGGLRTTCEGYRWYYFSPPIFQGKDNDLLITTAIENSHYYAEGRSDGSVAITRPGKN